MFVQVSFLIRKVTLLCLAFGIAATSLLQANAGDIGVINLTTLNERQAVIPVSMQPVSRCIIAFIEAESIQKNAEDVNMLYKQGLELLVKLDEISRVVKTGELVKFPNLVARVLLFGEASSRDDIMRQGNVLKKCCVI